MKNIKRKADTTWKFHSVRAAKKDERRHKSRSWRTVFPAVPFLPSPTRHRRCFPCFMCVYATGNVLNGNVNSRPLNPRPTPPTPMVYGLRWQWQLVGKPVHPKRSIPNRTAKMWMGTFYPFESLFADIDYSAAFLRRGYWLKCTVHLLKGCASGWQFTVNYFILKIHSRCFSRRFYSFRPWFTYELHFLPSRCICNFLTCIIFLTILEIDCNVK